MRKILIFIIAFLFLSAFLSWKIIANVSVSNKKPLSIDDIKIIDMEEKNKTPETSSLKVLSANLIAEFEAAAAGENLGETMASGSSRKALSPTPSVPKIKSIRILGEVENNGTKTVEMATPLVSFFDALNQKIAVKVASWSENYFFPQLSPQEKFLYDITIKDLPANFVNLSISFTPSASSTPGPAISTVLKIQNRNVDEKIASAASNQRMYYYTFHGQMINTGNKPIKNTRVVAYAKDADGHVFSWDKQEFPSDLFSPNQNQDVSIKLMPLKDSRMEQLEVFLFGEEL